MKTRKFGVSDGGRTRDIPDHNRVLYQLSYAHHVWRSLSDDFESIVRGDVVHILFHGKIVAAKIKVSTSSAIY
jgi:hypothetical protein